MFLAPSSSRAVGPYLQTLLLRVSLSKLGGKHYHDRPSPARGVAGDKGWAAGVDQEARANLLVGSGRRIGGRTVLVVDEHSTTAEAGDVLEAQGE